MDRLPAVALLNAIASLLYAQGNAPAWFVPHPQARGAVSTPVTGGVNTRYEAPVELKSVAAYYEQLLAAQGIQFTTGYDGIGTTIRGTAERATVLVRLRESEAGTVVQASYVVREETKPAGQSTVPPATIIGAEPDRITSPQQWPAWLTGPPGSSVIVPVALTQPGPNSDPDRGKLPYLTQRLQTDYPISAARKHCEDTLTAAGFSIRKSETHAHYRYGQFAGYRSADVYGGKGRPFRAGFYSDYDQRVFCGISAYGAGSRIYITYVVIPGK